MTDMNGCGVLTIAHGHPRFARQAVNLARSILLRSPGVMLAVVTDLPAKWFEGAFDLVLPWDFTRRPGLLAKLDLYAMSPFERTLFIDSDVLMYAPVEAVFGHFRGTDFGVIGQLQVETGWFESTALLRGEFGAAEFPNFVGGLYHYTKTAAAAEVFRHASLLVERYDELRIKRHDGRINDEPLFSLAMVRCGLRPRKARTPELLINPTWAGGRLTEVDVVSGRCMQQEDGRTVRRAMLHFYDGYTDTFLYAREAVRLEAAFGVSSMQRRMPNTMRATVRWLAAPPRTIWRLRRWALRTGSDIGLLRGRR